MNPRAMVTGATRRVGRAIALELARAGYDLLISWRSDREGALSVQAQVAGMGRQCELLQLDLARVAREGVPDVSGIGRLDALVLNAAAWEPSPWGQVRPDAMLEQMGVNAFAPLLLAQALQTRLAASPCEGGGSVVAIGDVYAAETPVRGFAAYMMSKAALQQAVRQMAVEMAPAVRVNAILPGVVAWPESIDDASRQAILARVPLARAGTPEDVARMTRFLCMEAPYVTGAAVPVDGGRSLR